MSRNFNQGVTNFNQSVTNFKPAVAVLQPAVAVLQESECLCQVNHPTTYLTFLPQHQNPPGTNTPALWRRGPATANMLYAALAAWPDVNPVFYWRNFDGNVAPTIMPTQRESLTEEVLDATCPSEG